MPWRCKTEACSNTFANDCASSALASKEIIQIDAKIVLKFKWQTPQCQYLESYLVAQEEWEGL